MWPPLDKYEKNNVTTTSERGGIYNNPVNKISGIIQITFLQLVCAKKKQNLIIHMGTFYGYQ